MTKKAMAWFLAALVVASTSVGFAEEAKQESKPEGSAGAEAKTQLVTEGEFAKWLVQVLGLSRFLSPNPSEVECFNALLQNNIAPKDGWNSTNVVTRSTLARVIVHALNQQNEVQDPENDASWIAYLKEVGLDISTIGAAVENLDILDAILANEAVNISSDPLNKIHRTRVTDDQQMGADLSGITRIFVETQGAPPAPPAPPVTPTPPAPPRPRPPPVTPN